MWGSRETPKGPESTRGMQEAPEGPEGNMGDRSRPQGHRDPTIGDKRKSIGPKRGPCLVFLPIFFCGRNCLAAYMK
jgi:hypothetical protein